MNAFAVTHGPDMGWSYVNLEATTSSPAGQPEEHDNAIISLEESVGLRSKVLEGIEVGLEQLPQTLVPLEGSGDEPSFGESALDLEVAGRQNRVQISTIESFIAPSHDLHVLLRHRLRRMSWLIWPARATALTFPQINQRDSYCL